MSTEISTEEKILLAARKIFIDKGLAGARMQDIADEAGINKAMLHYYFRSKDKLFETIFTQVSDEFVPKIFAVLQSELSLFEKIEMFCDAYIQQEIETPFLPMFIINEVNRDPQSLLKRILKGKKPPFDKVLMQIKEETKKGTIKKIEPISLLMNTISLCIFPFLARPMVQTMTGMKVNEFNAMMEQRKKEVPYLIINSIKLK